jgi:uncharacterized protein (DUF2147 family)
MEIAMTQFDNGICTVKSYAVSSRDDVFSGSAGSLKLPASGTAGSRANPTVWPGSWRPASFLKGMKGPTHKILNNVKKRVCCITVAMLCMGLGAVPIRAAQPSPVGAWITAGNDAVIDIYQCGDALCGAISGIVVAPTDKTPVDWQGQSQCGLVIVRTAAEPAQDATRAWFGSITNPRNGSVYHARLMLNPDGDLLLRGYVGLPMFGETQTWTRYEGANLPPNCRLSTTAAQTAAAGGFASKG